MPSNRELVVGRGRDEGGSEAAAAERTELDDQLQAALLSSNIVDQLFLKQERLYRKEEDLDRRARVLEGLETSHEKIRIAFDEEKAAFETEVEVIHKHERKERGRVTLNVGGALFETSVETLRQKSCFFAAMFSGCWDTASVGKEAIFIDRDPAHFPVLLNYLRSNDAAYLREYCYEAAKAGSFR